MSTMQLHGAIFVGSEIELTFWTPGLPKLFVWKSTYEKHKEFVSKTAPHSKFVEESGKTKFAVANRRVARSNAEATIPLRSETRAPKEATTLCIVVSAGRIAFRMNGKKNNRVPHWRSTSERWRMP